MLSVYLKNKFAFSATIFICLFTAACDNLNTVLLQSGYNILLSQPYKWTHPANLETETVDPLLYFPTETREPEVAIDSNGNAIIVFEKHMAPLYSSFGVFKSELRNGNWTNPGDSTQGLTMDENENATNTTVIMSDNGTAAIAWLQEISDNNTAWVWWYINGSWNTPLSCTSNGAGGVAVAMNNAGTAYVLVTEYDTINGTYILNRAEFHNGVIVNPPGFVPVNPPTISVTKPQVAIDNHGNVIMAWEQTEGSYTRIYRAHKKDGVWLGGMSGTPISLTGGLFGNAVNPQVAISDNGSAAIAWTHYFTTVGAPTHVYRSYYNGSTWSHPSNLTDCVDPVDAGDPFLYTAHSPQIALDSNGNGVMVWCENHPSGEIHLQMSQCSNGTWTSIPYSEIASHFDPTGGQAKNPDVAMDNRGDAVITWAQYDGSVYTHIYISELRSGNWQHPAGLEDHIDAEYPGERSAFYPRVAINGSGSAVITWQQPNTSTGFNHVYKSEYRPYTLVVPFK